MDNETLKKLQDVEMELALEFRRVCEILELDYFLDAGTLLGAVRHRGFIPWDDDIDVAMLRKDFEIFLQKAPDVLDKKYSLQTMHNDKNYGLAFAKLRKKGTVFIEEIGKDTGAETGIFIDIFPYDVLPDDPKKRESQGKKHGLYRRLLFAKCGYRIWTDNTTGTGVKKTVKEIAYKGMGLFLKLKSKEELVRRYEEICTMYNGEESEMLYAQSGCRGYAGWAIPRSCVASFKILPFEGEDFLCPVDADLYLKTIYHDYMKLPPESERVNRHQVQKLVF